MFAARQDQVLAVAFALVASTKDATLLSFTENEFQTPRCEACFHKRSLRQLHRFQYFLQIGLHIRGWLNAFDGGIGVL